MTKNTLKKLSDITEVDEQFRELCLYYSSLLQIEGIHARPFRAFDLPVFSALPPERKRSTVDHIRSILEVFEDTVSEGTSLRNSRKLTWRAVAKLGMVPQSDIFDKLKDSDVITIYSNQNVMLFQSLNFFEFVSVTLEDLYSNRWDQCSRREAWALEKLLPIAVDVFTGRRLQTFDPLIPEHYCEEVGTEELLKFYIHIRLISPLRTDHQVSGALVANACRPWDGKPCLVPLK
jgi:hypothetical protein